LKLIAAIASAVIAPHGRYCGTTTLLDYCRDATTPTVLVVPSLIDRYYVHDLLPERSSLQHLASSGLRSLVIDWQAPGSQERPFDLIDDIAGRLEAASAAARQIADGPIGVVGYCMGGLLALATSPALGHVGMMAAARAPDVVWTPIANWLRARLDER
jgi:poly(3-hydroxyalkanoate) synthetase